MAGGAGSAGGGRPGHHPQAYADAIARVQRDGGYATVDAIRMTPDHPDREPLRRKFLEEHTHAEDEVRFFVEGCGLFVLHIGSEVLSVLCERGDLMRVPAGTRHWFDMGSQPRFCAVRWFNNPEGGGAVHRQQHRPAISQA